MWSEPCQIMLLESENVKQAFEEQDIWVQCNLQYRQYHKKTVYSYLAPIHNMSFSCLHKRYVQTIH